VSNQALIVILCGRNSNVILTRQTCGQRSGMAAACKRRVLAFGRAASGRPLSSLRATRNTPEFVRNFSQKTFVFHFFEFGWLGFG